MAVRFDGSTDGYICDTDLAATGTFSMCCWGTVDTDRNEYSTWLALGGTGANSSFILQTHDDGLSATVWYKGIEVMGTGGRVLLTLGKWYFLAVSVNGAAGNMYVRAHDATTTTVKSWASGGPTTMTPTNNTIGYNTAFAAEWLNGRVAAAKIWNGVALSQAEFEAEMWQTMPARTENLIGWYPLHSPETADYSGNGRTLTANGSPTQEGSPPIPWRSAVTLPQPLAISDGGGAINANAGTTLATATAYDATVTTQANTTANAEHAAVSVTANNPTVTTETGIQFVNSSTFSVTNGTNTANVEFTMPSGIQVGDTLLVAYGNIGNYRQEVNSSPTMESGWRLVNDVTDTTNCYMLVAAKDVTSTDVGNIGNTVLLATLPATTGTTYRTAHCTAYRNAAPVGSNFPASALVHEATPGDATVNSGSATNTSTTDWYVCAFNAATGGGGGPGTWTSTAPGDRGESAAGTTTFVSNTGIFDSNGPIGSIAAQSKNGTISFTPSRLNGWVGILKVDADETVAGPATVTATANNASVAIKPSAGPGVVTATANNPTVSTSASGNAPAGHASATATANNASVFVKPSAGHASITATANNVSASIVNGGGTTQAPAGLASVSVSAASPIVLGPPVADLVESKTLVLGPGTVYIADFGAVEPANIQAGSTPSAAVWTDLGGIWGGVDLHIEEEWRTIDLLQVPGEPIRRLQKRKLEVTTELAEATLLNLSRVLNDSAPTSGAGFQTYSAPLAIDQATVPTYRALLIQGWAPRTKSDTRKHRQRLIIMRKCLSISGVSTAYKRDGQTTFKVTWAVHYVDGTTAPFKVIDEGP